MRGSSHAIERMHTNVCMSFNVFVRVNISILRHPCASAGRIGLWSPRESLPSRMPRQHMFLWMLTRHRHRCLDRGCACRFVGGGLWWCVPACWAPGGRGGLAPIRERNADLQVGRPPTHQPCCLLARTQWVGLRALAFCHQYTPFSNTTLPIKTRCLHEFSSFCSVPSMIRVSMCVCVCHCVFVHTHAQQCTCARACARLSAQK